jgi:hypothetical protein
LKFPDDAERCPGHRGNAVIQYTPFKIKDFLEHLPTEKKAKCETGYLSKCAKTNPSLDQALNEGDGVYRP